MVVLCLLAGSAVLAGPEIADVREAADRARMESSLASPDRPLWRTAIRLAEELRAAEPDSLEAARLLAGIYSEVAWHSRAFSAWLDWAGLSGQEPEAEPFAEAALQLGFARLRAGDPEGADHYYGELLVFQPDNAEALWRSGAARLEAGHGNGAEERFRELLALGGDPDLADGQLQLARHVTEYGAAAGRDFAAGLAAWEAGDYGEALAGFEAAWDKARQFGAAAVWAGRTALELGEHERAARWWRIALDLDPDDERSRWFLERAERLAAWGEEAVAHFDEGQELYGAASAAEAFSAFRAAARAAPRWTDALAWTARTAQEAGDWHAAAEWWQQLADLDPDNESAAYFLRLARQRTAFGDEADEEFLQALDAFQRADFAEAERGFRAVTEDSPDHAAAWGYLGQIHFAKGSYAEAEAAYREAARLRPDSDEYAFFAAEAARLADPLD